MGDGTLPTGSLNIGYLDYSSKSCAAVGNVKQSLPVPGRIAARAGNILVWCHL